MIFIPPVRNILVNDAALTLLIGASAVFTHEAEQKHLPPDVIVTDISGTPGQTLTRSNGLWVGRVQIECRGTSAAQCRDVGDAVLAALNPQAIEFQTFAGVQIQMCRHQNDVSYKDPTTAIYYRVTDFTVGGRKV